MSASADVATEVVRGQLEEVPRGSWPDVAARLPGSVTSWLWADQNGVETHTALPVDAPITTHVWGWGDGVYVRLRVDRGEALGAVLTLGDALPALSAGGVDEDSALVENLTVSRVLATTRGEKEQNMLNSGNVGRGLNLVTYRVDGRSLLFIGAVG